MSSCKRIIARLDVKGQKLIKGIRFEGLRVIGDACDSAKAYAKSGVDEIFYTDAVASLYGRNGLVEILRKTSQEVFVPITAGGAIRSVEDGRKLLAAGADKLAINTGAVRDPELIDKLATKFGQQCIVLSIQASRIQNASKWNLMIESGREISGRDMKKWIIEAQNRGIGEIFITSVDRDGTGKGPDIDLLDEIMDIIKVPLVFGGGIADDKQLKVLFDSHRLLSGLSIGWGLHHKKVEISSLKNAMKEINLDTRSEKSLLEITEIKESPKVAIIDYGMGNLQSLINAFNSLGISSSLIKSPHSIDPNGICILPGVGSFPEGIKQLNELNLLDKIVEHSNSGGCLVGICLGMQLLFEKGMEYKECKGLSLIQGTVDVLPSKSKDGKDLVLPHVGWNKLISANNSNFKWNEELQEHYQYFVHSYAVLTSAKIQPYSIFNTNFSGYKFCSMVRVANTIGMQFHPERSGIDGLNILKNIINSFR